MNRFQKTRGRSGSSSDRVEDDLFVKRISYFFSHFHHEQAVKDIK